MLRSIILVGGVMELQTQMVSLPKADIFMNSYVSFGIEFEFYPSPRPSSAWIPNGWRHQADATAGEEIATPILLLDFSNPVKLIKSYIANRKRVFWDLHNYAKNNNCVNFYLCKYARYASMGGHIHVSLPTGISFDLAQKIATYIKSILPLTAFLAQFDPTNDGNYSRRIWTNITRSGYCNLLPEGRFISMSHYGMISYNPLRTIEVRVQDSAPPQVLLPIAYIYSTLFASALKNGKTAPRDYLMMTENVHRYEMAYAIQRKLKMSKIVIRWIALCRGDIPLPKDVAYLVWLALNRIAPMDYAKDVGLETFYRACQYASTNKKFYVDHFLVLVRKIYPQIHNPKLKNVYKVFVQRFGKKIIVWLSDILKLYSKTTVDINEREVITAFLQYRKKVKNKLIQKCIKMAYREEWEKVPYVRVRRIGAGNYSRENDAEWIYNTISAEDISTPEDVITHRDRFYIIEDRNRNRIGVIRVTWVERIVRGVWLTRELSEEEIKDLRYELLTIARWFADAVFEHINST